MNQILISTNKSREIVDITDDINSKLSVYNGGSGVIHLLINHTTAALTTADLDPGTDLDMLDAFERMVPKLNYRHPHNPNHVPDHIMSSLIGTSITLPFEQGRLILGAWQRVVLVELNGPRERTIIVSVIKED